MPAQIRPNRLEVTDRFPMLGFSLSSTDGPRIAEVVLASDIALFADPAARNSTNFYSSREHGVLAIPANGSVYTVPPLVMARFIAANRLYFGLATASAPSGQDWRIDVMPGEASPYVSLSGLTDRALRRVRMFPVAPRGGSAAPVASGTWVGDTLTAPAPAADAPSAPTEAAPPAPVPYNDGFGPLEPLAPEAAPTAGNGPALEATAVAAQGLAQAHSRGLSDDPEDGGIECSGIHTVPLDDAPVATAAARGLSLTAADYPRTTRIAASPAFTAGRSGSTIDRIVIHITDAPTTSSTVNHFTNAAARASAHYLVGQDGEIIQFVNEADTAWHAGNRAMNRRSVGIEHVAIKAGGADYPRRDGTMQHYDALPPSDTQYCESAALVSYLCQKYGIEPNRTNIIGHNEANPTTSHSVCPTGNWNWDHFMRLVTEQVCAPQPTAQGLARAFEGGTDTIEIKYRAFIPSPALSGPFFDNYHGDGRGFSYSGGTSRGELTCLVDMSPGGGLSNLRYADRHWSDSHSYSSSDTTAVAGKPDWWLDLNSGAVPTGTAACALNDDTLRAFIGGSGTTVNVLAVAENASLVTIWMAGNNPLIPGSPDIDATMAVLLRRTSTGAIEAKVYGSHDGFPAHELYVNGNQLYTYDPVAAGNGPTALMAPEDISADTGWTTVSAGATSQGLARAFTDVGATEPDDGEITGPVHDIEPAQPVPVTASALDLTAAEYPDARVMVSPNYTRGRAGQTIDRIVIHITSSVQSPHLGSWFQNPASRASAHYMVDQLGAVRQFVAEADTAWHAGNRAMNRRSIGIEHVAVQQGGMNYTRRDGSVQHFDYLPPSDIEYTTSAGLVAHLCRKYNLTPDRTTIIGHAEANPNTTHTACPTGAWDWDRFMGLVSAAYAVQAVAGAVGSVVDTVRDATGLALVKAMSDGDVTVDSQKVAVTAPAVEEYSQLRSIAIQGMIAASNPALLPMVVALRAAVEISGYSVGVGPHAGAGLLGGAGFGFGLIFAPGNKMGAYGGVDLNAGLIAGIGAQVQVTIVNGGIDAFGGVSYAAGISGGEFYQGGAAALFDANQNFNGVQLQVGVGVGLSPVEIYTGVQRAISTQLGIAMDADDWSINWDDIYPVGQPTGVSCWATAASMIEGWRLRQSIPIDSIANFDKFTVNDGLPNASHARFAESIGFTVHPNACYTPEGFRDVIEANGPVWVVAKVPGQHAIVVTGMYRKDGQYYVRITDPWDRVVGSPGAPGSYASVPSTGSQYIMTYDAFTAEFEAAAGDPDFPQLLHTGGTHGHTINRGSATAAGYAQGLARQLGDEFGTPVAVPPSLPTPAPAPLEPVQTRQTSTADGRSYDLAQLAGMLRPSNALAGGAGMPPIPGQRVVLNEWPYIEEAGSRTSAPVAIDWKFDGAAVGDVTIVPEGGAVHNGRTVQVRADIEPCPGTPNRAELLVRVTTTFSKAGEPDEVAVSEVTLGGDGMPNTRHAGTQPTVSAPAPSAPAPAPAAQPQPAMA